MADKGYTQSLLSSLPTDQRTVLVRVFDYVLGNLRFGVRDNQDRAENFQLYRFDAVTSSVANTEFSISHGMAQAPYLLMPILPLDSSGGQIVRLKVTRAADSQRVYLSSADTGVSISVMVET